MPLCSRRHQLAHLSSGHSAVQRGRLDVWLHRHRQEQLTLGVSQYRLEPSGRGQNVGYLQFPGLSSGCSHSTTIGTRRYLGMRCCPDDEAGRSRRELRLTYWLTR
jgi:hypothetical protein